MTMLTIKSPESGDHSRSRSLAGRAGDLIVLAASRCRTTQFDPERWEEIFDDDGLRDEYRKACRRETNDAWAKPNLQLANYAKGPVSQAYGWLMIALGRAEVELTRIEQKSHYNGDPIEQALLWLVDGFGLKTDVIEIDLVITHLRAGRIEIGADCLEDYMLI